MTHKKTDLININGLQAGPTMHEKLSRNMVKRILAVARAFAEVEEKTENEWLNDFQRDWRVEKEIALWEVMAGAYSLFTRDRDLPLSAKKEAYELIVMSSFYENPIVLRHFEPVHLSGMDVQTLLRHVRRLSQEKAAKA